MHSSVLNWFTNSVIAKYPHMIRNRKVIEVGSYDVNGSVRPIVEALEPSWYLGVDQSHGPGVDTMCNAQDLVSSFGRDSFDTVISTEMMEHLVDWRPVMIQMVEILAPGGILVITTRSDGFPYHPYPIDTWRYSVDTMARIVIACGLNLMELASDPEAPGVFMIAQKPLAWFRSWNSDSTLGNLNTIEAEPMKAP